MMVMMMIIVDDDHGDEGYDGDDDGYDARPGHQDDVDDDQNMEDNAKKED